MGNWLEEFWAEVLSRDPERVRAAMASLTDDEERMAVLSHLQKMATEAGWADPQRISAQAALDALTD